MNEVNKNEYSALDKEINDSLAEDIDLSTGKKRVVTVTHTGPFVTVPQGPPLPTAQGPSVSVTQGLPVSGTQGHHMPRVQGPFVQEAQGPLAPRAQGPYNLDAQGPDMFPAEGVPLEQGVPVQASTRGEIKVNHGSNRRLTEKQKQIFDWLATKCGTEETRIMCLYRHIEVDLGISKKAAKVNVDALEKKGFISTSISYRPGSNQRYGKNILITGEAWQYYQESISGLTLKQKQVFDYLDRRLKGQEGALARLYWCIGIDLRITPKAARGHVEALKKKGFILTEVVYRRDTKQRLGVRISIPSRHSAYTLSEALIEEIRAAIKATPLPIKNYF